MEKNITKIVLEGLPKISLNVWYSSTHWTKRKAIKDNYYWIIKSQTKKVFSKEGIYKVSYSFHFKKSPLDAMNCSAMGKLIEDVIFEKDGYKVVTEVTLASKKDTRDYVVIEVTLI